MLKRVARVVAWSSELSLLPFTLVMAAGGWLGRLPFIPILLLFGATSSASNGAIDVSPWLALIVGPVVETVFLQALPIRVVSALRGPIWLQLVVSTTLFGLAHLSGGAVQVAMVVSGGLAFAWAFIRWSQVSAAKGFLAAAMTHSWVNAFTYLAIRVLH